MVLEIKNGDSKPLSITEIQGEYIPVKIMFKTEENGKYKITFGDENIIMVHDWIYTIKVDTFYAILFLYLYTLF